MGKIWVHKADSFKSAENFDTHYYLKMSNVRRLETVQFLRAHYFKLHPRLQDESRKGLRRFLKVTQQK